MNTKLTVPVGLFAVVLAGMTYAQDNSTPNVVSPLIDNGTVTLSIFAPNAERVTVTGDWMIVREPLPLERAANGVWSVTIDDLKPDYYSYTFNVDGVSGQSGCAAWTDSQSLVRILDTRHAATHARLYAARIRSEPA